MIFSIIKAAGAMRSASFRRIRPPLSAILRRSPARSSESEILRRSVLLFDALALASTMRPGAANSNVAYIAATENAVSITCTDNKVGTIATRVPATIHNPGETAVCLGRLAGLVSGFAADAVVEIETSAAAVSVVSGPSRLRLPVDAVAKLSPAIAIDHEIGRAEISGADCLELLEPLAAADPGLARIYLSGVFWHSLNGRFVAVSTDGKRLIRTSESPIAASAPGISCAGERMDLLR